MATAVLELRNLTKTYIIGTRKNARKAQKEIQRLQARYEQHLEQGDKKLVAKEEPALRQAQELFASEQFEASYALTTGRELKPRPQDRGVVVHALNGVNLKISAGDLLAVMGPSGSGKSTLLNMLGLLDAPTAGQILLDGRNVTAIKPRELPDIRSRQLGFVFQAYNLIPTMTALENVMMPLRYAGVHINKRRAMAAEALKRVGLENRMQHSPNELSGGQQQRVAIARSIVNSPTIIFGDELTGELDSKMTGEVMELIEQLNNKGLTFVIVTHNPEVAKHCRRIIFMKDGKIEKEANRENLHKHLQLG